MLDLGASELLLLLIVAVVVIGPKDLPLAMRTVGRWAGKIRRVSAHFRSGIDTMIREAELEEMEKKWKAQNEAIMAQPPEPADMQAPVAASAESAAQPAPQPAAGAEAKPDPQSPPPPP